MLPASKGPPAAKYSDEVADQKCLQWVLTTTSNKGLLKDNWWLKSEARLVHLFPLVQDSTSTANEEKAF